MNYTIYDPATGKIINQVGGQNADSMARYLEGKSYLEGKYDGKLFYVKDGVAVAMPTEPRHSYKKYKFNWDTHEWAIDLVATERLIRSIRNNLFANIDKMNPVWYSTLSDQQKQELVDYRQAIIDITDQPNFPLDVVFPTAPTWL